MYTTNDQVNSKRAFFITYIEAVKLPDEVDELIADWVGVQGDLAF